MLLSVGLRGEVDPRESLPLKSHFLTAIVFRYIVRLAFASIKHNVLVRVHVVKCGFTLPARVQVSCRRPLSGEGPPPPDSALFFHVVFYFILERIFEDSGHSLGYHFQQKSEKRRLQCSMKRDYENGPGKNAVWDPFKP